MVENEHPGGFKPAAADRQPEPNSGEGAASLEGKCVCSVCGAILGEFAGQGTSHGLCQTCRQKVESGDPATLAEIKQSHREGREVTKIDQEIFKKLEVVAKLGNKVVINWYYDKDDEEIYSAGMEYKSLSNIPFKFVAI